MTTNISQNLPSLAADLRLTLCYAVVATAGTGPSLQEISTAELPEGALAYSVGTNRFYRLRKSSTAVVDTVTNLHNVVAASNGGNWVACIQMGQLVLSAGAGTIVNGFDLTGGGYFTVNGLSNAGTTGTRVANKASSTTVSVTSSSNTDTSSVLVQYIETAIG